MRKVLIEKIGNATNVTAWDTKKPDKKVTKSYNKGADFVIENNVLIIDDSNNVFPKQRILFSELDENYGTTDIESFGVYLNENGFFLISGGSNDNSSSVVIVADNTALVGLITNNELIPGAFYRILSADPNLYGGTEITLTAITSNQLSLQGSGLFYCPKYDLSTPGYGIWTTYMEGLFSNVVGTFTSGETVTAQNGATAKYLAEAFLEWISGDWSGATSISGATATADVSGFISPSYAIGTIVHWGGKSWTNVNGNVGTSIDKYTLDAEWTEIPFNATDYNVYVDEIQYDFGNDMIIYRKDRYNNVVSGCHQVFVEFESPDGYGYGNPIKDFQWGCAQDDFNTDDYLYIGIQGNQVIDSYFETLNTRAKYIWFNELSKQSYIQNNTLSSSSYISNNTLSSSSHIQNNTLSSSSSSSSSIFNNTLSSSSYISNNTLSSSSYIQNNTLSSSSIFNNTLSSSSYISNNTLSSSSHIQYNTLSGNSYIQNNTLSSSSYISNNTLSSSSHIQYNTLSGNSYIQNNTLSSSSSSISNNTLSSSSHIQYNTLSGNSNSYIQNNTLSSSSYISNNTLSSSSYIQNNTLSSSSYIFNNTLSSSSYIQNNTLSNDSILQFTGGDVVSKTLTRLTMEGNNTKIPITATIIFNPNISKTIFKREDGASRLQYVNNLDVIVITNVNA